MTSKWVGNYYYNYHVFKAAVGNCACGNKLMKFQLHKNKRSQRHERSHSRSCFKNFSHIEGRLWRRQCQRHLALHSFIFLTGSLPVMNAWCCQHTLRLLEALAEKKKRDNGRRREGGILGWIWKSAAKVYWRHEERFVWSDLVYCVNNHVPACTEQFSKHPSQMIQGQCCTLAVLSKVRYSCASLKSTSVKLFFTFKFSAFAQEAKNIFIQILPA